MASATAAGSAYSTHGEHMIPFYIFYSMFGFQRTGDSIWAMADQLARGFLIGATAGRTTLTGEGLQHADGHSPLLATTNPAVVHYDPAFAYEVSHIMKSGLERMYGDDTDSAGEDVIFYITVYNEPIVQPKEPDDVDAEGILKRHLPVSKGEGDGPRVQLLGSGVGFPWVRDAARMLREDWGVAADTWSVTSWNELARDADLRRGVEPAQPRRDPADGLRLRQARRRRRARWSRSPTTCAPYRSRSRAGCPATTGCSAPTASASPTPARLRGGSSTSTPSPSSSRRSRPSPTPARSTASKVSGGVRRVPHRRSDRRRRRQARGRRRLSSRAPASKAGAPRRACEVAPGGIQRSGDAWSPSEPSTSSRSTGSLRSRARQRAREYVAGWVDRTNSWTIFANRCGWSLCGKWPALGITSTCALGASMAALLACRTGMHLVVASPDHAHRHRLGEVGPVGHGDDLATPVDDGLHHVPDGVPGAGVLERVVDLRHLVEVAGCASTASGTAPAARPSRRDGHQAASAPPSPGGSRGS